VRGRCVVEQAYRLQTDAKEAFVAAAQRRRKLAPGALCIARPVLRRALGLRP
jgi:hypothetical protein